MIDQQITVLITGWLRAGELSLAMIDKKLDGRRNADHATTIVDTLYYAGVIRSSVHDGDRYYAWIDQV